MAFPLLLRGLSPTYEWIDLARAEVPKAEEAERPVVDSPQVSKLDICFVVKVQVKVVCVFKTCPEGATLYRHQTVKGILRLY